MDFAKLSAERYSLRKYSDRPVEAEKLALILESGRNAPTAHNNQPQRIFVLQSPEALEKADACMGSHFHPPVILAVAYDPAVSWHREHDGKDHGEIDAAIVATQMMLQAADLGLGTTYVGMFDPEKLKEDCGAAGSVVESGHLKKQRRMPYGFCKAVCPALFPPQIQ